MLVGATSASAYYERWDGWFSEGWIEYNNVLYEWGPSEGGYVYDYTYSATRDTFYFPASLIIHAHNEESRDSIELTITSDAVNGGKETGTEGIKTGGGVWEGEGYVFEDDLHFDIWGTWTGSFNYNSRPDPTYTASATSTGSRPAGIYASISSSGERTYYSGP